MSGRHRDHRPRDDRDTDDGYEQDPVALLLARRGDIGDVVVAPDDATELAPDDELLLVGWPAARRLLDTTLISDATREYVLHGRYVPASWVWRTLTRRPA